MARNSGFLIRHLVGNRSNPCADLRHHRKLLSNSTRTLAGLALNSIPSTTTPSSSPKTMIHSTCKPLSFSLHFLQHRRLSSPSNSDTLVLFSSPPEMVLIKTQNAYKRAIKQVKDGRLAAVFYFTISWRPVKFYPTLRKLRERFPHVTIYKVYMSQMTDQFRTFLYHNLNVYKSPTFHFYQNGRKVDEILIFGDDSDGGLEDTFAKLYKCVIPIETPQLTSSYGMGERKSQQLVKQAKINESCKGAVGGRKVGVVGKSSQESGRLVEAVKSTSVAPSLREVMNAVQSIPIGRNECMNWYVKGLFQAEPEKRVLFTKDPRSRIYWVLDRFAEE